MSGILAAIACAAPAAQAAECDVSYAATGGQWSEPENWQGGSLPTSAQNVCIPAGHGTVVIPFGFNAVANRIQAQSQLDIALSGKLTLSAKTPGEAEASHFDDLKMEGGSLSTAGTWLLFTGNTEIRGSVGRANTKENEYSARLVSGTLSGGGTYSVPFVNEGGDIEPGGAGTIGLISFDTGFAQTAGGTLTLDVAGPEEVDVVQEGGTGEALLAGAVDVRVIPPFSPRLGEVWTFAKPQGLTFEGPAVIPGDFRVYAAASGESLLELAEGEGPAPQVTRLSTRKGPATGGTSVTITGTGFASASEVLFGATPAASVIVSTSRSITAVSPPGTAGKVEIVVKTPHGQSAGGGKARFAYEGPTVTGVSPATGPDAGGTPVTVTGSGFAVGAGSAFKFGKIFATSVSCASTTECTMLTPAVAKPGTVDVRATAGGRTSKPGAADRFTFNG
ncbi:MAG TPA: IPT/TIG domain-containing protein [Solirubrobacteraceae bacterium]|nr:IPT/TIG domain-containing protein [Solirubrobacteraceae bacterium]